MSEFTMSKAEREAFLAGVHVGVLAVERDDGPPLASPVWYRYWPGGEASKMLGRAHAHGAWVEWAAA